MLPAAGRASSTDVTITKQFCTGPTICVTNSAVPPGQPIFYRITLINTTSAALSIALQEQFSPSFVPLSASCAGNPVSPTGTSPVYYGPVALGANASVTCEIHGYFKIVPNAQNNGNNTVTVVDNANHATVLGNPVSINATVDPTLPLPVNVALTKKTVPSPLTIDISGSAQTVTYQLTLNNTGTQDVYLGDMFVLYDRLVLTSGSIPLGAHFVSGSCQALPATGPSSGSDCLTSAPGTSNPNFTINSNGWTQLFAWQYANGSPGLLKAGGSLVLTYQVKIDQTAATCVQQLANGFTNNAYFNLTEGVYTLSDANPADNTTVNSVAVTTGLTQCQPTTSPITIQKVLVTPQPTTGGIPWPGTLTYRITVTNNTQAPIPSIAVGDYLVGSYWTPPFKASVSSWSCAPAICAATGPATTNFTQTLTGGYASAWMADTTGSPPVTIQNLAAGAHVDITLTFDVVPDCDVYPANGTEYIGNVARATYTPNGGSQTSFGTPQIAAYMAPAPQCKYSVTKNTSAAKIAFNTPITYTVVFSNLDTQTRTIGTLVDDIRLSQYYANSLTVDKSYACTPSGGLGGGYPTTGATTAVQATYVSLGQQGVRIFSNPSNPTNVPVIFPPGASLSCTVTVTVHAPAAGDPYCSSAGSFENFAFMDPAEHFNTNYAMATITPQPWASVKTPLPKCYNLVVNKYVNPTWTPKNGPPLNYQITIQNKGDPLVPGPTSPVVADTFTPVYATTPQTVSCSPLSPACAGTWTSTGFRIDSLAANQTLTAPFTVAGSFPNPGTDLCNKLVTTMTGPDAADWYAKDPNTLNAQRCVPVKEVSSLIVKKTIDPGSAPIPSGATFPVDVACQPLGPNPTVTLSANTSQTVANIPINSTCTVTEQTPVATIGKGCTWETTYPGGQSVQVVQGAMATLEVRNKLVCPASQSGSLALIKTIDPASAPIPAGMVFPIQVTCIPSGPLVVVNLTANGSQTVANIPSNSTCTVVEQTPLGTIDKNCHWETDYPGGQSAKVVPGSAPKLEVRNRLVCGHHGETNGLTIFKTVSPSWPAGAVFPVQVSCSPGGPNVTINLTQSSASQVVASIPVGSVCSVVELTPIVPHLHKGCKWQTLYPFGQTVTIQAKPVSQKLEVHNVLCCEEDVTNALTVFKTVAPMWLPGALFPVQIACTNGGPNMVVNLTQSNPSVTIPGIPIGSVCTVTELPAQVPGISKDCIWQSTYPVGQKVEIKAPPEEFRIEVHNALCCIPHDSPIEAH